MSCVIAIIGGIHSGKSTVSRILYNYEIPVFDADRELHDLYKKDVSVMQSISSVIPWCVDNGNINLTKIKSEIIKNPKILFVLEEITSTLIHNRCRKFIESQDTKYVILDFPLLLELDYINMADIIVCVSSYNKKILSRCLNMNSKLFNILNKRQIPLHDKEKKSDMIVYNNGSIMNLCKRVICLYSNIDSVGIRL